MPIHLQPVSMEPRQCAAMANTDQQRTRHFRTQQRIQGVLEPFVHRRSGLVEEDEAARGPQEHEARESEALLLAQGGVWGAAMGTGFLAAALSSVMKTRSASV